MVPELSVIRGLIKKKFPMIKNKTISTDLVSEVQRLKSGMKVRLERSDREPDYGFFELPIGTVCFFDFSNSFNILLIYY